MKRRWNPILDGVDGFAFKSQKREFDRNKRNGGILVARPIAQKAMCKAAGAAYAMNLHERSIVAAINRVPQLSAPPWRGLLWNPEDGTMFARKERMDLTEKVFCLWMGIAQNREEVEEQLRIITSGAAKLPQ